MGHDAGLTPGPYHRAEQGPAVRADRDPQLLFGGGVLLGAVVLGLVWALVSMLTTGSHDTTAGPPDTGGAADTGVTVGRQQAAQEQDAHADLTRRCSDAVETLGGPLSAAAPAMDQWAVHIGAMNKLVAGTISLSQANAFWARTRVGAHRRIATFRGAMGELRREGIDCPLPAMLPTDASTGLRSCARLAAADLRTLRAAKTAVDTWAMHVHDMELLRTGKLSPADATRMWLMMWRRGQDQLDAYRADARAASGAGSC